MSKTKTSRITNIALSNFRIHRHLNADTDKKIISIYGDNGSGKTTILEAVSLLASTKGMLDATVTEQDYNSDINWTGGFELGANNHNSNHAHNYDANANKYKDDEDEDDISDEYEDDVGVATATANHNANRNDNHNASAANNNNGNTKSGCGNHSVLLNINHAVEIKFERDDKVGKKRKVSINGKPVTKHGDIAKWCNVVWFTSGMQHEYISSSSDRRKFFDRLVRYMFPEHSSLIYKYEELLKNRMKSLESRANDAWLKAIERKISQYGVEIVTNRSQTARMINDFVSEDASDLPKIKTELRGEIEDEFMKNGDTEELELFFAAKLMESRQRDLYSSRNNVGPHRVIVNIGFNGSFIGNFSSGQQKMMFISLINAVAKMVKRYFRIQPVMLIDEVLSFLDEKNTRKLLDGVASDVSQVWLTSATKINTLTTLQQCTKDEIAEISL